ncbi:YkgJ family cysteine cluster protein [Halobaculum sp. MBLA0147]|uniref:YkgJ family cysteine cluster protein n=1 Tax=Halobaculum sp. MBLA0147 TaxID=3079934 RepID=UPI0035245C11
MQTNCEGCAGCCVDWRPLGGAPDHERRGRYRALDDTYNLVPLTSDEVRAFLAAGLVDALAPRLFVVGSDESDDSDTDTSDGDTPTVPTVEVDDYRLPAADGRPLFAVGLRTVPKPVAPFDTPTRWLETCVFLDPETLQCRIHDTAEYPRTCRTYPGHNLALETETECGRVERAHGTPGERLVDGEPPAERPPSPFGPQALGGTVFAHPEPDALAGTVARVANEEPTPADCATFVGVAAASTPGSLAVDESRRERATERIRETADESWAAAAAADWERAADRDRAVDGDGRGHLATDPPDPSVVEEARGAPSTPGWDAVE